MHIESKLQQLLGYLGLMGNNFDTGLQCFAEKEIVTRQLSYFCRVHDTAFEDLHVLVLYTTTYIIHTQSYSNYHV